MYLIPEGDETLARRRSLGDQLTSHPWRITPEDEPERLAACRGLDGRAPRRTNGRPHFERLLTLLERRDSGESASIAVSGSHFEPNLGASERIKQRLEATWGS